MKIIIGATATGKTIMGIFEKERITYYFGIMTIK
jgi:hypothetical protein